MLHLAFVPNLHKIRSENKFEGNKKGVQVANMTGKFMLHNYEIKAKMHNN